MNNEMIMMAMFVGVILTFLILIVLVLLDRSHQRDLLNQQAQKQQEQLSRFEFQINQAVSEDLHRLSEKVIDMELSVNERLHQGMISTNDAMNEVKQQMVHINDTQNGLSELSKNIQELQQVMIDKKTRGIFGEVELYSILEQVFGVDDKRYLKQAKLSNGTIVDALLIGNDTMGSIPIDSKFPLENYRRIYDESLSVQEQQQAAKQFKLDVTKHIKDIHNKYVVDRDTSDFAYMFIPAEAIYAYIYANMDDVVQFSYSQRVYIVSATTLMAYLTAMRALYLGKKRDEAVVQMQQEYNKLAKEFERYEERVVALNNDFEKVHKDFNQLMITQEKIQKGFKRIENVEFEEDTK